MKVTPALIESVSSKVISLPKLEVFLKISLTLLLTSIFNSSPVFLLPSSFLSLIPFKVFSFYYTPPPP